MERIYSFQLNKTTARTFGLYGKSFVLATGSAFSDRLFFHYTSSDSVFFQLTKSSHSWVYKTRVRKGKETEERLAL